MHRALSPACTGETNALPAPRAGPMGRRWGKVAEITKLKEKEQTTVLQDFKSIKHF